MKSDTTKVPSAKFLPALAASFVVALLALALAAASPQSEREAQQKPPASGSYEIDPVHSSLVFRCKHLDTAWIFGRFGDVQGTIRLDADKPGASTVEVEVDAQSIDTGHDGRDNHLRGPDFFDVAQFPAATFKSKSVAKKGANVYAVTGELSIHGVTKTVTIDMEHTGSSDTPKQGKRVGFLGELTIQRKDYGITFMPDGLSNDVPMTLSFEAVLQ